MKDWRKNKQGQIFIILSLIIMLFIVSIGITFVNTNRAVNQSIVADEQNAVNTADNINQEMAFLAEYVLGLYTRNVITVAGIEAQLRTGMNTMTSYLQESGFAGHVSLVSGSVSASISAPTSTVVEASLSFQWKIYLESSTLIIQATKTTTVTTSVWIDTGFPAGPTAFLTKTFNGYTVGLSKALTSTTNPLGIITDNYDGTYSLQNFVSGDYLFFITQTGVNMTIQYP